MEVLRPEKVEGVSEAHSLSHLTLVRFSAILAFKRSERAADSSSRSSWSRIISTSERIFVLSLSLSAFVS
jgi:hypothetical protein